MLRVNNLVGFGAGAASGIDLAFKASATSSAATIAWPSVAEGDMAVLFDYAYQNISSPTQVTPSGFSVHVNEAGSATVFYRVMISSKICDGTESGNLTGMDGGTRVSKILLVFSGGITARTSSSWNFETTAGDPSAQNATASSGDAPLVVFGVLGDDVDIATFTTESPAFDDELTVSALRVGYKVYQSGPQDHSIDTGDNGIINILASGYIEAS